MNRRFALGGLALGLAAPLMPRLAMAQALPLTASSSVPVTDPAHPLQQSWAAWKSAYLSRDGRVTDTLQDGASHSESQGYGLLLAATFGDAPAFEAIDGWTQANLAIRPDGLLAWRWLPAEAVPVPDRNNAADGDLFYAWALVRAAKAFGRGDLLERAGSLAADLARACLRAHPDGSGRLLFTPAAAGFAREGGLVVNPSYTMPRAMAEIAEATGQQVWAEAARDGETLLSELAGQGLVPDWITVTPTGFAPDATLPERNGYEALRVALFLIWSGSAMHPAVAKQAEAYARAGSQTPTVFDRLTFAASEISPDAGYAAIAGLVACSASGEFGAMIPRFTPQQPYYPATLHLFVFLAQIEASPSCLPI